MGASLANTLDAISASYDPTVKATLGTLDAEHQQKATRLLDERKQDADKTVREKLGLGGRAGRGDRQP